MNMLSKLMQIAVYIPRANDLPIFFTRLSNQAEQSWRS